MNYEEIEITVRWEVEDGYSGKSRPQATDFKPSDWVEEDVWNNASEDEKKTLIEQAVRDDFENRITFVVYDFGV